MNGDSESFGLEFSSKGRVLDVILEDEKRGDIDEKVNVF